MKSLYIIAGCNGAGKTTASYTILPEILECEEYINADEIAKGLSPFYPERVAIQAGRLMLNRIKTLLKQGKDFAFETTLSTRSYRNYVERAQKNGYEVTLIFLWLSSQNLAIERVHTRVKEGGHNIPKDVIKRRYVFGLRNFFSLYSEIVDNWIFIDNSGEPYKVVAERNNRNSVETVYKSQTWDKLKCNYNE